MSVIKGLAFFFFVLVPGLVLVSYVLAGGAWVLVTGATNAGIWGLETIGVPDERADVVLATLVVASFGCLVFLALGRGARTW
jgi:hypothetical protein